ncbi:hypothetical protein V6N13_090914 [Hibiscus sabdariffa]|uniref:Uncharacterized protein n=1 Tax=Hibiscus sabdariffa TaxID=183260 RepID=A0ABR2PBE8_9ROSI
MPPGVLRTALGSPLTRSSLSLLNCAAFWHDVDWGEARRAWLAASMHGYLESPRMGPGSLPLHLGLIFTTCGAPIGGCALVASIAYPPWCAPVSMCIRVLLCGCCVFELQTATVHPTGPFG